MGWGCNSNGDHGFPHEFCDACARSFDNWYAEGKQ